MEQVINDPLQQLQQQQQQQPQFMSQEQMQQFMFEQRDQIRHLTSIVQQQQQRAAAPAPRNDHFHAPKVARPDTFSGAALNSNVDHWIFALTLHFEATRNSDPVSQAEVAATLLKDGALVWWISMRRQFAAMNRPHPTWEEFQGLIRQRFSPIEEIKIARTKMLTLKQQGSVREYCARFQQLHNVLAGELGEQLSIHLFTKGLRPEIALQVDLKEPATLTGAMSFAQRMEESSRHIYASRSGYSRPYQPQRSNYSAPSYSHSHSTSSPMELGNIGGEDYWGHDQLEEESMEDKHAHEDSHLNAAYDSRNSKSQSRRPPARRNAGFKKLTDEEHRKRLAEGLCFECAKPGHQGRDCPVRTAKMNASGKPKNV